MLVCRSARILGNEILHGFVDAIRGVDGRCGRRAKADVTGFARGCGIGLRPECQRISIAEGHCDFVEGVIAVDIAVIPVAIRVINLGGKVGLKASGIAAIGGERPARSP